MKAAKSTAQSICRSWRQTGSAVTDLVDCPTPKSNATCQGRFEVTKGWSEVRLPLDSFIASGALLRRIPRAGSLTSVAVVAYGRDHDARIDVREVGLYGSAGWLRRRFAPAIGLSVQGDGRTPA